MFLVLYKKGPKWKDDLIEKYFPVNYGPTGLYNNKPVVDVEEYAGQSVVIFEEMFYLIPKLMLDAKDIILVETSLSSKTKDPSSGPDFVTITTIGVGVSNRFSECIDVPEEYVVEVFHHTEFIGFVSSFRLVEGSVDKVYCSLGKYSALKMQNTTAKEVATRVRFYLGENFHGAVVRG